MATKATLLRAVRKASLASRAAAAAASRADAMVSRSARAAGIRAAASLGSGVLCPLRSCPAPGGDVSTTRKPPPPGPFPSYADYPHMPDHAKTPTDKDMESDEAIWALYERWCKVFKKQRDPAEMALRFRIFKLYAESAYTWNTCVPEDPEEAAICLQNRREAKLLLAKGEDVSQFDDGHVPYQLGTLADGGDPFLRECDYDVLKRYEAIEAYRTAKVIVE